MTTRLCTLLGAMAAVALSGCAGVRQRQDSLDLKQLRIVDDKGVPQLILAGSLPGAKRKIQGGGIIFNDAGGHEIGGVAMVEKNHQLAICFDYAEAHSEAMCMYRLGEHDAGLWINDPRQPGDRSGAGKERLRVELANGQPAITLNDRNEKPRIRVLVDASDAARIEILDGDGKVLYQLPAAAAKP